MCLQSYIQVSPRVAPQLSIKKEGEPDITIKLSKGEFFGERAILAHEVPTYPAPASVVHSLAFRQKSDSVCVDRLGTV